MVSLMNDPGCCCLLCLHFTQRLQSRPLPLTLQHFDGHFGDPVWLLLVQTHHLSHHHLAEAAFTQRLSQNQPVKSTTHKQLFNTFTLLP